VLLSWVVVVTLLLGLAAAAFASAARRAELARIAQGVTERERAVAKGSHRARLQYPEVDLSRCIGCGICVAACPEEGVLEMVHGQALVVHGARCVGHGRCAIECPVGAIAVTLGDVGERRDIPALTSELEAVGAPNLFLAGEVTGYALVRTAVEHGTACAREIARRVASAPGRPGDTVTHDLVIVGAGPAGIACSLEATRLGLAHALLEQEELGGTVAKYPRRKLVMTQPLDLPLHGRLDRTTYTKEELVELWNELAVQHQLPVRTGRTLESVERASDGCYVVRASGECYRAAHVVLALGRRGTPRKLEVPGEELPKVAYGLVDAASFTARRILVVGGGDSAIEAAVGLAEQPGNEVTLSYRKESFFRLKAKNEARILEASQAGRVRLALGSRVLRVLPDSVELASAGPDGAEQTWRLANDEVFVLAGGIPPFPLLESAGVSFDPALRPDQEPAGEQGTGLGRALLAAFVLTVAALVWLVSHAEYYGLPLAARGASPDHAWLRPSRGAGLAFGIGAVACIALNLLYLLRRSPRWRFRVGSLRAWMTAHVATGVLALLLAILHSAMAPRNTVGGHAFLGLVVLVVTGAIGRYLYAFVPRAANGRELALDEVRDRMGRLSEEWDRGQRAFGERVRAEVQALVEAGRWTGSLPARLIAVLKSQGRLREVLERLEREGRAEGLVPDQLSETLALARRAHRTSLAAAHYEEVRGLLASWRYLHRWVALLAVILVFVHIVTALRFGGIVGGAP